MKKHAIKDKTDHESKPKPKIEFLLTRWALVRGPAHLKKKKLEKCITNNMHL